MEALSLDLRERVAAACDEGFLSRSEIAEEFRVSLPFITNLLRRRKQTGSLAPKAHAGGFASALDKQALKALAKLVTEQPDATLQELRDRLAKEKRGVSRSVPVICRALAKLGLTRKKSRCMPASVTRRGSEPCGDGTDAAWNGFQPRNALWWTNAAPQPQ